MNHTSHTTLAEEEDAGRSDLIYQQAARRRPRPELKCANCSQLAKAFCKQCGAHLCVSCDHQIHGFLALRSHVRVESVEEWRRETEQRQVKRAMAQIEVAIERQVARKADEQERARGARAAIQQHFDRMREARERALEAKVDEWERNAADAAAKRRVELAEAQARLASAGEALQQDLAQSATLRESWEARRAAKAARAAARASSSSSITFVSEDARAWARVAGSSGQVKVEPPMRLSSCEQS